MEKASQIKAAPTNLEKQLEELRSYGPRSSGNDGRRRLHSTAEIEIIVDGPGDRAPVAGESARRS